MQAHLTGPAGLSAVDCRRVTVAESRARMLQESQQLGKAAHDARRRNLSMQAELESADPVEALWALLTD